MQILRKLKALVNGERQDLQTGEIIGRLPGHYEVVDPTPLAPPVGYKREPTLMEKIQLMVMKEKVDQLRAELGAETPAEAEDFDIDDDDADPSSPYEFERHELELLEQIEKTQRRHAELSAKYPQHDFGPVPFAGELGGAGGTPPAEAAPAAVPAAQRAAPEGAEPPSDVKPVANQQQKA